MRNIFVVDAKEVNVSQANPQGVFKTVDGYPKTYDSRNYNATEQNPNGDEARALEVAQAEFYSRVSAFLSAGNRAMWSVTLTTASGRQVQRDSRGAFPDMTPVPEPEPEEEVPEEEVNYEV